jgi:hypothetical protein
MNKYWQSADGTNAYSFFLTAGQHGWGPGRSQAAAYADHMMKVYNMVKSCSKGG